MATDPFLSACPASRHRALTERAKDPRRAARYALLAGLLGLAPLSASPPNPELASESINRRVEDLLSKMTLEEKVGQMVQFTAPREDVGPSVNGHDYEAMMAAGQIGAFNVADAKRANAYQKIAVEKSRLHIPLMFGLDVVHGYQTVYPIPLGLAATFDPDLVTRASHMAALEARADAITMTNSPMVDIARDARWGRTAEGAGESPYLGSALAAAYVRGYQGSSLGAPGAVAACVKHFAAYGAPVGGRDYNAVDMSDVTLRQVYLPPYKAAIDAGAAVVMSAFNSLNSVPETADPYTMTEILRKEWGFAGFVRADYNAVAELIAHGVATDGASAARLAVMAGVDMDMASGLYNTHLVALVRQNKIPEKVIDEAVRRILRVKFALGLFERPYVDEPVAPYRPTPEKRSLARKAAEESIVLLKNQAPAGGQTPLPIAAEVKTIALIGPLADANAQMLGTWHAKGRANDVEGLRSALEGRMRARGGKLLYAQGTRILSSSKAGFEEAVADARAADLVVLALGEDARTMTGEATSRANLDLPGNQEALLEAVVSTGKPVVLIVFSGRPLVLNWAGGHVAALLAAWFPGIEAGPALVNILFGDVAPSGKLPVSFPRSVGQEPLYLEEFPTGRPAPHDDASTPSANGRKSFVSGYVDLSNRPLYPFGFGLSYTHFSYSNVTLNHSSLRSQDIPDSEGPDSIEVNVAVRNDGSRAGTETVQLYLRIRGASLEQPVRELRGFERVDLSAGESKQAHFHLGFSELSIVNSRSQRVVEPADYTFFVGGDSDAPASVTLNVLP